MTPRHTIKKDQINFDDLVAPPIVHAKNFVKSNRKKAGKVPVIKEMSLFWKGMVEENSIKTRK
tara:strand:+ start:1426 stop:1614 length:189 start_codon:yes stop_codon:yes gene_type:complete